MRKLKKVALFDLLGYCNGFSCPSKQIEIISCEKGQADTIIKEHHYSHKVTKNSFLSFLVLSYTRVRLAEHCSLYDKGYSRIGCICCPMSQYRNKIKELKDYPHVKRNWIKTFEKLKESGYLKYDLEASEMFDWWTSGKSYKKWYTDKFLQQKIDFGDGEE